MPFFLPSPRSTRSHSRRRRPAIRRPAGARGFSLVEMLVAVAIVGLLVGLIGPAAMGQLQSSRVKTTQAQIVQIRTALDIFQIDTGRMPTEAEGLEVLVSNDAGIPGWNGPYLRDGKLPLDGWSAPFLYTREGGAVIVQSLGADGVPGGEGNDADVAS